MNQAISIWIWRGTIWQEGVSLRGGVVMYGNFCYGPHKELQASSEHGGLRVVVAFKLAYYRFQLQAHMVRHRPENDQISSNGPMSKRFKSLGTLLGKRWIFLWTTVTLYGTGHHLSAFLCIGYCWLTDRPTSRKSQSHQVEFTLGRARAVGQSREREKSSWR